MTEEALTFSEPVLGFRAWKHGGWVVMPRTIGDPWEPGVQHATCEAHRMGAVLYSYATGPLPSYRGPGDHAAPQPDCECGIYALHKDGDYANGHGAPQPYEVRGVVAGWGNMEVHASGWRSEFAQILAFEEHDTLDLARIAKTYGVPVVAKGGLEAEGLKHAQPLPASVVPDYVAPAGTGLIYGNSIVWSSAAWTSHQVKVGHFSDPQPKPRKPDSPIGKKGNRQGPARPKRAPRNLGKGGR